MAMKCSGRSTLEQPAGNDIITSLKLISSFPMDDLPNYDVIVGGGGH